MSKDIEGLWTETDDLWTELDKLTNIVAAQAEEIKELHAKLNLE